MNNYLDNASEFRYNTIHSSITPFSIIFLRSTFQNFPRDVRMNFHRVIFGPRPLASRPLGTNLVPSSLLENTLSATFIPGDELVLVALTT